VFENRVLKMMFESKRDGVTGEWRKLHNVELHDLYCLPDALHVIKFRTRWVGHVARMEKRNTYRNLERKRKGKRLLGRPNSRREIMLNCALKREGCRLLRRCILVGTGTSAGLL
jgi:hypothetical protein